MMMVTTPKTTPTTHHLVNATNININPSLHQFKCENLLAPPPRLIFSSLLLGKNKPKGSSVFSFVIVVCVELNLHTLK